MDKLQAIKIFLCGLFGGIGGAIAHFFGGWDKDVKTLIAFMAIDFITGLILAGVFKKSKKTVSGTIESRVAWKGLCRKGVIFIIVLIAHRVDVTLGIDFVRIAVVTSFITSEAISIIENAGLMGVPIPKKLRQAIEILRDKAEEDEDESDLENVFYEREDGYDE